MKRVLSGLKPEKVFEIFENICAIPHGSGNCKGISDYCVNFARERGLFVLQDDLYNVIIKKGASAGYENSPPVILQGHIDMVCEKDENVDFDFERDGLRLKLDGDLLSASGTTLGADDGIAVAIALSVLDNDTLLHPELEVIFTVDEEVGMSGAAHLDTSSITARRFISLDHGEEKSFTVGCCGGVRVLTTLPLKPCAPDYPAYKVTVSGLIGGHSGEEIDKGRLNANKVLASFLSAFSTNIQISEISGGSKTNAIPATASCVVCTDADISSAAENFQTQNRCPTDNGLEISIMPAHCDTSYTVASSKAAIGLLCAYPNGIQAMSEDIEGLVETSLNVGIVWTEGDTLNIKSSLRSSKSAAKSALEKEVIAIADRFGAKSVHENDYPAWEYKKDSPLRETMVSVYEEMYGKKPEIRAIHAGLECGIFSGKISDIDAVSAGADMFDIHTSRERLSVSSLARTYNFICKVLERLK